MIEQYKTPHHHLTGENALLPYLKNERGELTWEFRRFYSVTWYSLEKQVR